VASEIAFFEKWWRGQTEDMKAKFRQMVHDGRFLFVGGGWTQNDEATTHYSAIIDNLSLGMKFIEETFGISFFFPVT
jgi:lysosomal alpha-mannosidase